MHGIRPLPLLAACPLLPAAPASAQRLSTPTKGPIIPEYGAAHRGLRRDELDPAVDLALSAMTALVTFQTRGYSLISF